MRHQEPSPIHYDVEISGVREVSLLGTAELGFWRNRLVPEGFYPVPVDGRAELMVSATNAKFHGIPFRELSFGVFVSRQRDSDGPEGLYLVQAFNSVRFFAFVERTFFSTPYSPADLSVDVGPPARIELRERGRAPFRLEMTRRSLPDPSDDGWEGPVFLPRRAGGERKLFFARLGGETTMTPFDPSSDVIAIEAGQPVLDELSRSDFHPREWILRPDATHGKSKTRSHDAASGLLRTST